MKRKTKKVKAKVKVNYGRRVRNVPYLYAEGSETVVVFPKVKP